MTHELATTIPQQPAGLDAAAITPELLAACRAAFDANPAHRLAMNACSAGNVDEIALNRRATWMLPPPYWRISVTARRTKSSQSGVRQTRRRLPSASRISPVSSRRRPTCRSRWWIWSIASTAVVGSLMAGDSALAATSTSTRNANAGSCS